MHDPIPDFFPILRTLANHQVDFIVIGGVAAVLHGAPLYTFDLDVVHSRAQENLERLLEALEPLNAYYRGQGERRLKPKASFLVSPGHHLLMTSAGPLDLLGTVGLVGAEQGYDELLPHSKEVDVADSLGMLRVRILDLDVLIRLKQEAGRDKDRAALPVLRRTLEEQLKATEREPPPPPAPDPNPPSTESP
jgi:hypothetical protein